MGFWDGVVLGRAGFWACLGHPARCAAGLLPVGCGTAAQGCGVHLVAKWVRTHPHSAALVDVPDNLHGMEIVADIKRCGRMCVRTFHFDLNWQYRRSSRRGGCRFRDRRTVTTDSTAVSQNTFPLVARQADRLLLLPLLLLLINFFHRPSCVP